MRNAHLESYIMERLIASQTPLGRACIYLRLRFFRLAWLIAIHGAKMVKRALDVIGAVSMLVAFSPVMLALVLLVKLDGGPVLFRQIRIGRLGREFVMFKAVYGGLDAVNNPTTNPSVYRYPTDASGQSLTYDFGKQPYMELGFGIGNIFKVFRIDVTRRLNYLDNPNTSKWRIQSEIQFGF